MSAQLDQILNYLDREGVTEVIVAVGQPMQFRRKGTLVAITAAQLTRVQVAALTKGTPLAPLLGIKKAADLDVGKRALHVEAGGTPEAPSFTISKAAAARATSSSFAVTERPRRSTRQPVTPRGKAPSQAPRTRGASKTPPPADESAISPPARARASASPPNPTSGLTSPDSIAKPRTISRASPIAPAFRDADDAAANKVVNRLTRSGIKIRTPAEPQRTPQFEVDPDPPATRAMPDSLSLELDDDLTDDEAASEAAFELGASGIAADLAIHSARSAPPPPAFDANDHALDLDALGPRVAEGAPSRPTPLPVAHLSAATIPSGLHPIPRAARPAGVPAFVAVAPPAPVITPMVPHAMRELIDQATARRASDLHLIVGRPPCVRMLGALVPLCPESLSAREVEALVMPLLDHRGHAQLAAVGYSDFALELPTGGRLRSNIARCQGGLRGTFRIARAVPPTLDDLGLPKELAKVIAHHQGLVVIAGPSGHGKTTTLAALVDLINTSSAFHIITVEDPIEIVYPRKAAVVSQREVGPHTRSFAAALKGSLREDPDVIVIGELRDRETVEIALTAAETGHLVLATMSAPSAAKTIDRLVDMFPPDDQQQVRASIAGALRAIVSQRLLPTAAGDGVVAAVELLTGVLPLMTMIRDDKLFQLPNLMQRGRAFGMIRLDDSLTELVRSGKITSETALSMSDNRKELGVQLAAGTGAIPRVGVELPGGLFGGKKR